VPEEIHEERPPLQARQAAQQGQGERSEPARLPGQQQLLIIIILGSSIPLRCLAPFASDSAGVLQRLLLARLLRQSASLQRPGSAETSAAGQQFHLRRNPAPSAAMRKAGRPAAPAAPEPISARQYRQLNR